MPVGFSLSGIPLRIRINAETQMMCIVSLSITRWYTLTFCLNIARKMRVWTFAYYDTSSSTGDKNDGPPYICTVYKVNRAEKRLPN